MTEIYLYGAGGLGREVKCLLDAIPEYRVAGFIDDAISRDKIVGEIPTFPPIKLNEIKSLVISIGDPRVKAKIYKRLKAHNYSYPVVIHPSALLMNKNSIHIGQGTIITAGVILTTDIHVGNHVLLNLNCTVGHDVSIGDCTSVMPGVNISGNVQIGKEVLIGTGATILNGIKIGDGAVIGAGAVVTRDVQPGCTVAGVPARIIEKNKK